MHLNHRSIINVENLKFFIMFVVHFNFKQPIPNVSLSPMKTLRWYRQN